MYFAAGPASAAVRASSLPPIQTPGAIGADPGIPGIRCSSDMERAVDGRESGAATGPPMKMRLLPRISRYSGGNCGGQTAHMGIGTPSSFVRGQLTAKPKLDCSLITPMSSTADRNMSPSSGCATSRIVRSG
jgi:hypothetical protein